MSRRFMTTVIMIALIWGLAGCNVALADDINLNATQFKTKIDQLNQEEVVILDVRTKPEFDRGHLENAQLLNFYSSDFPNQLASLPKSKTYLLYCHSGGRSAVALKLMQQFGFNQVHHLEKGIVEWNDAGLPLKK